MGIEKIAKAAALGPGNCGLGIGVVGAAALGPGNCGLGIGVVGAARAMAARDAIKVAARAVLRGDFFMLVLHFLAQICARRA
jgi:hypothetical protein